MSMVVMDQREVATMIGNRQGAQGVAYGAAAAHVTTKLLLTLVPVVHTDSAPLTIAVKGFSKVLGSFLGVSEVRMTVFVDERLDNLA